MTRRLMTLSAFLSLWIAGSAYAAAPPPYYLALGDSLSRGVQPNRTGVLVETNQGYVDDLYAYYHARFPELRLKKLGCSGESTRTMITGGPCGNQLNQAVEFIQTHHVVLITLTIGGDNILRCISATTIADLANAIDPGCVAAGLADVTPDLAAILGTLRGAGPDGPIVAMNYNDPLLGLWRFGDQGRLLAAQSLQITQTLNGLLEGVYSALHVPVADVAQAFRITDGRLIPLLDVPVNVFLELSWTWMNLSPPLGPDVHPNGIGYGVIAGAFVKAIGTH